MLVRRFDSGEMRVECTPTGGVRVDAFVTRVGVLTYQFPDGTTRRELRRPEEVFAEDSIASLRGAAVTDDHPPEMVSPENWATYSRGHVGDDVRADGAFVRAPVNVSHADLLRKVADREVVECSCGYLAEYVDAPGEWEGEPYDGEQRGIRYNHVALGPRDWGRAGPSVRLLLDSNAAMVKAQSTSDGEKPMLVTLDGKSYDLTKPAEAQAYHAAQDARHSVAAARADAAELRIRDLEASHAATLAEATKRADAAERGLRDRVEAEQRTRLIAAGRRKDRAFCADKKDAAMPLDAMIARVIKMYAPNFDPAGKSPEVLAAVLEAVLPAAEPAAEAAQDPAVDATQETAMGAEETDKPAGAPPAHDSIHAHRGARVDAVDASSGTLEAIREAERVRRAGLALIKVV